MIYLALFAILFAASYGQEEEDGGPPFNYRPEQCFSEECIGDDNCNDDWVCIIDSTNGNNNYCAECASDDDCNYYPNYYCVSDACVRCGVSADCDVNNPHCVDNDCVECADDTDCTDSVCAIERGNRCVDCVDDDDCTVGCVGLDCTSFCFHDYCVGCVNDTDCVTVLDRVGNEDQVFCDRENMECEFSCAEPVNFTLSEPCDDTLDPPTICRADLYPAGCITELCIDNDDCSGDIDEYNLPGVCANDDETMMNDLHTYCVGQNWKNSPLGPWDYCFAVYNETKHSSLTSPDLEWDSSSCVATQCHPDQAPCSDQDDKYSITNPFSICMQHWGAVNHIFLDEPGVGLYGDDTGVCVEDCNNYVSDDNFWCTEKLIQYPYYLLSCGSDGQCGEIDCSIDNDCQTGFNCGSNGKCSPFCINTNECSSFNFDYGYFCQNETTSTCEMDMCTVNADCRGGFVCDQIFASGKCFPECSNDDECQSRAEDMDIDGGLASLYACNITGGECYYGPDDCSNDDQCRGQAEYENGIDYNIAYLYACNTTTEQTECYYSPDDCSYDWQCSYQAQYEYGLDSDIANLYECNINGECYYTPGACSYDYQCQEQQEYEYGVDSVIANLYACNTTTEECYYTPQTCWFNQTHASGCECDYWLIGSCATNGTHGDAPTYRCEQVLEQDGVCVVSQNCDYYAHVKEDPYWCMSEMHWPGYVCNEVTGNCDNTLDCNIVGCRPTIALYAEHRHVCADFPLEIPCDTPSGFCDMENVPKMCTDDNGCDDGYICSTYKLPNDDNTAIAGMCVDPCSEDAYCEGLFCDDYDPEDGICDRPEVSPLTCTAGQCVFGDKDQCSSETACESVPGIIGDITCLDFIPFLPNLCYVSCSADADCHAAFTGVYANHQDMTCIPIEHPLVDISFCDDGTITGTILSYAAQKIFDKELILNFTGLTYSPTTSPTDADIADASSTPDDSTEGAAEIHVFGAIIMVGVIKLFM